MIGRMASVASSNKGSGADSGSSEVDVVLPGAVNERARIAPVPVLEGPVLKVEFMMVGQVPD